MFTIELGFERHNPFFHGLQQHHLLTYSMEQSPSWEAKRLSASQEIQRIL
jgi:hypothetical protein